ncbi:AMP-dependent synthetase/ligase [Membranicola marinus]|uniref:AMP-dependent synthetase/ligase n=1 Tax=Membranihabitans marinus TaxID=1227546 RepID=A0A953HJX2_9BACT|nr:AMP-dependent synthetase/ligase [Membranihabitans marinus]MBY5957234.1 AMP-dependent synthetase/ligase [Membranihabitans marinus]
MKNITRLFDVLPYQMENYPLERALAGKKIVKDQKKWVSYSTEDVMTQVDQVSLALHRLGIRKGDKIAMVSENRPEWNILDLGILQIGAVNVPVYPTITRESYQYIFNEAGIKYTFVSNDEMYKKVNTIQENVPSLIGIYSFDELETCENWKILMEEVSAPDKQIINAYKSQVKPADLATLIYTSGTTGNPKGVMLSHHNLISNFKAALEVLPLKSHQNVLSFLPLCHSFERIVSYAYMASGLSIYYAENMDTIGDNLKEVKPQMFTTVPRLLEKVYERIMEKGHALTGIKRSLFFWALGLGEQYQLNQDQGWWYNTRLKIARKLIFSKWKDALGGRVEFIATAAAAMNPQLATIFTAANIPILEGYGLTETSPVLTVNRMDEKERKIGTVGIPIPGLEIKIASDGEIMARGPNIMLGYYKQPRITEEVIEPDGWFHTGDIGEFDGPFLKITDRKKALFKTSGGKYVAPQQVEMAMMTSRYIEQIMVLGNNRKFVSALIVPSFVNLRDWCAVNDIPELSNAALIEHPRVLDLLEKEITRGNKSLDHIEQIKKFTLMPEEWTIAKDELTPTMKVKRKSIRADYKSVIEKMYG